MANSEYIRVTEDGYLELRMKLTDLGSSSTGKSTIMLSSGGWQPLSEELSINLVVVKRVGKDRGWLQQKGWQ